MYKSTAPPGGEQKHPHSLTGVKVMKPILKMLAVVIFASAIYSSIPHVKAMRIQESSRIESTEKAETIPNSSEQERPLKTAEKKPEKKNSKKVSKKPTKKCRADQWVRADNGECLDKPKQLAQSRATTVGGGSGSCAAEIAKYDWNQSTALAVARAESGLRTWALNDNPATGDYSVGCFQINIYGANARTRPSEAALKDAATNVRFAYGIYVGNGRSFIGQWGVCRHIACY